jgi:DNA (cytosine-5)-methyltransferase 1
MPEVRQKPKETWPDHQKRLEREHTSVGSKGVKYRVLRELFNAADYGAPQKRHRVFIVGFREDQNVKWSFPNATHSEDVLLYEKWVTGQYWERHEISAKNIPVLSEQVSLRLKRLRFQNHPFERSPWRTVRDALQGLPAPIESVHDCDGPLNHRFQGGARTYPGHTGSPIDEPSKALKAGDHGVPGGENMIVNYDGSVRYFTVREAARIQGFPDGYVFHGSWTETMRQLGNAVPVMLAQAIASSVATHLTRADIEMSSVLHPRVN